MIEDIAKKTAVGEDRLWIGNYRQFNRTYPIIFNVRNGSVCAYRFDGENPDKWFDSDPGTFWKKMVGPELNELGFTPVKVLDSRRAHPDG